MTGRACGRRRSARTGGLRERARHVHASGRRGGGRGRSRKCSAPHARRLAVNSTKSMIGHCLSAAGIVELVATVLQLRHQVLHPTINQEVPDPELDLDFVPNEARDARLMSRCPTPSGSAASTRAP